MENNQKSGRRTGTVRLAKMGMLVAIAVVLVYLIHFPILPMLPFMEYDPADVPIMIGTFAFGPLAGIVLTAVTCLVQGLTVSASSGVYGIIMHFVATGTYVLVAGLIYYKHKSRKSAVIALIAATVAVVIVMVPANYFITSAFMGVDKSVILQLMPFIMLFNLIKMGANSIITFLLYKRISGFLHR